MPEITKVKTANHEEWLALRSRYIGGSDVIGTTAEAQIVTGLLAGVKLMGKTGAADAVVIYDRNAAQLCQTIVKPTIRPIRNAGALCNTVT